MKYKKDNQIIVINTSQEKHKFANRQNKVQTFWK